MILQTKELQETCKIILGAVDGTSTGSNVSEVLELHAENGLLKLSVTNREYFVTTTMEIDEESNMHYVIDASLFLNLISKITSETIEIYSGDNYLGIRANGEYKLPYISDENGMVELTPITIENTTLEFNINTDILNSIAIYNTKELTSKKNAISSPVQKLYYIDEQGAITFTTGACVNNFTLEKPVKLLLNAKLIKLFSLFKGSSVGFVLGHDQLTNTNTLQTKVCLYDDKVKVTSIILNDPNMLASVPVKAIRGRANNMYEYSINISKDALLQTINRLMLFNNKDRKNYNTFIFTNDKVSIYDTNKNNVESINYATTQIDKLNAAPYETMFDLVDIKAVVESCQDTYLNIQFGDRQAIVVARGNIKNIIPEVRLS